MHAKGHESVADLLEKVVEEVGVLEKLWGQGHPCNNMVDAVNAIRLRVWWRLFTTWGG